MSYCHPVTKVFLFPDDGDSCWQEQGGLVKVAKRAQLYYTVNLCRWMLRWEKQQCSSSSKGINNIVFIYQKLLYNHVVEFDKVSTLSFKRMVHKWVIPYESPEKNMTIFFWILTKKSQKFFFDILVIKTFFKTKCWLFLTTFRIF